jgi:isocitrate/isopropylmalate dehydrogenase
LPGKGSVGSPASFALAPTGARWLVHRRLIASLTFCGPDLRIACFDSPVADARAAEIDRELTREQARGPFDGRLSPEKQPSANDDEAVDLGRISHKGTERRFDFAFHLALQRLAANPAKCHVTCVDKAKVTE